MQMLGVLASTMNQLMVTWRLGSFEEVERVLAESPFVVNNVMTTMTKPGAAQC